MNRFCLNNHVLDRLDAHFKMPAAQGTLLLAPPALSRAWTTVGAGHVVAQSPTATHSSQQDIFGIQMLRTDVRRTVSQYGVFERAYVWALCWSSVA